MILVYHKVHAETRTHWYVSADRFNQQLAALSAYEVVHLDDYDPANPRHCVLTFDGVYADLCEYALPLLEKWRYPFELFVVGDYVGAWNTFDQPKEPPAQFASLAMLERSVRAGGRIQWHTRTHSRLETLDDEALARELSPNEALLSAFPGPEHFRWFAFPHGDAGPRSRAAARARFLGGALACEDGELQDRWFLPRKLVFERTALERSRVSVIIPNFNYGSYLPEAIESALHQSVPADEILVIDDASTDDSREVIEYYRQKYPGRLQVIFNETNLGIVDNFNKAVAATQGDFIAFLGADNRMRADYVERCRAALDQNPDAGVVYTDMTLFGPLAEHLAARAGASPTAVEGVYLWRFPAPTPEVIEALPRRNVIHGSSMYRRSAFEQVGGYSKSERAEDHNLFLRMVERGLRPVHVPEALIEYRQHSRDQANTRAQLERQLSFYRRAYLDLRARHQALEAKQRDERRRAALLRKLLRPELWTTQGKAVTRGLLGPERGEVLRYVVESAKRVARGQALPKPPPALERKKG